MFPDAFVETGEVGWFGKEKPHWGRNLPPYSQPRELMRGFPQADLNEAASAADAYACLLRGGSR
jgi:hypothetical protein